MFDLKKTAVTVLAFSSSAVFAGSMGPVCTPGNVTVPCARTAWDFGAQALYLKAGTGTGDYVGWYNNADGSSATLKPNNTWAWGFQIAGSYHFNTGNDVNLNWYHIDRSNSQLNTIAAPASQTFVDAYANKNWLGVLSSSGSRNWDAINLELGQQVNFSANINTRFHGGFSYARVKTSGTLSGVSAYFPSWTILTPLEGPDVQSVNLSFNGVGPRVGADSFYDWNNGFAVYAKGAMALFVGQSKVNAQSTHGFSSSGTAYPNQWFSFAASTTQVVPELEGKLGGTYTYAMAQGDLSVDLGWMWINYFNPLNNSSIATNFNLQGPYVGLKWVGNVA